MHGLSLIENHRNHFLELFLCICLCENPSTSHVKESYTYSKTCELACLPNDTN